MVEELFKLYNTKLLRIAHYIVNDEDIAKDITQDLFIKLINNKITISPEKVENYLVVSIKNLSLNYLKEKQLENSKALTFHLEFNQQQPNLNEEIDNRLKEKLEKYMTELPPKCRLIFSMSRFEGLSNNEISTYLDISKRTVETQISNALKILREKSHSSTQ